MAGHFEHKQSVGGDMFDFVENWRADVAEEARIATVRLKNCIDEAGGGAFSFRAGDADDIFTIDSKDKFEL